MTNHRLHKHPFSGSVDHVSANKRYRIYIQIFFLQRLSTSDNSIKPY